MMLSTWPKAGTRVRDDAGRRGRVTGSGGHVGEIPVALVWWDGRPYEDVVSLYALELDEGDQA